jgi:hypothetical protein
MCTILPNPPTGRNPDNQRIPPPSNPFRCAIRNLRGGTEPPAFVSFVASIGSVAFLGGPPLIGLLGDHVTVHHVVLAVAVLRVLASFLAGSLRPAS